MIHLSLIRSTLVHFGLLWTIQSILVYVLTQDSGMENDKFGLRVLILNQNLLKKIDVKLVYIIEEAMFF